MEPVLRIRFCAGCLAPLRAVKLMTFFTRVCVANTPFIDLKIEDTKYHCSHFKLIGFLLSWTFLNIILSPSPKASWSSYLNPVVWLERAYWYSMIALLPRENRSVWFGKLLVRGRQTVASLRTNSHKCCFVWREIVTETNASEGEDIFAVSEAQFLFNMQ